MHPIYSPLELLGILTFFIVGLIIATIKGID